MESRGPATPAGGRTLRRQPGREGSAAARANRLSVPCEGPPVASGDARLTLPVTHGRVKRTSGRVPVEKRAGATLTGMVPGGTFSAGSGPPSRTQTASASQSLFRPWTRSARMAYLLGIDVGTQSVRSGLFDLQGGLRASAV